MKRITQEQFDDQLQHRVNLAANSLRRLLELIEQRPDLMDEERTQKTFAFLQGTLTDVGQRCQLARQTRLARDVPFSLTADVPELPPIAALAPATLPHPAPAAPAPEPIGRLVGQGPRKSADDDGVDFISDDEE